MDADARQRRDVDAVVDEDDGAVLRGPAAALLDGFEQVAIRQRLLADLEEADPRREEARGDLGDVRDAGGGAIGDRVNRWELQTKVMTRPRNVP